MEIIFALSSFSSSSWLQCDQIGRFLNVFGDKVSFKTDPFQTNFKTSIFKSKLPRLLYGQLFILASGHSAPELLSFASYLIIHIFFVRGSISVGTVDLLFDWFGFGQTGKSDNNLNVKSCWIQQAVKQYFSFTSILSISRYVNSLWSMQLKRRFELPLLMEFVCIGLKWVKTTECKNKQMLDRFLIVILLLRPMDTDKRSQRPLPISFVFMLCNTCDVSSFATQISKQIRAPHVYQSLMSFC